MRKNPGSCNKMLHLQLLIEMHLFWALPEKKCGGTFWREEDFQGDREERYFIISPFETLPLQTHIQICTLPLLFVKGREQIMHQHPS